MASVMNETASEEPSPSRRQTRLVSPRDRFASDGFEKTDNELRSKSQAPASRLISVHSPAPASLSGRAGSEGN